MNLNISQRSLQVLQIACDGFTKSYCNRNFLGLDAARICLAECVTDQV